jgi:hypothetical protein
MIYLDKIYLDNIYIDVKIISQNLIPGKVKKQEAG